MAIVATPASTAITYIATDLDEYAAALADLAEAIERRDGAAVVEHIERIRATDPDTADTLTDWLSFQDMFEDETEVTW
ncbi:hypothetical protein [Phytohabitans aurantiacus]|uniref:Uncharacterized protein n=1 Tax=Phytohabitans aurantiacus TaxID=3016789 RepID=A0ABQ5QR94_9ACTN|nr:hypothetical protein [Phytohabitans aurantiacus]GLH97135.1 hypothetical protein Pa4123_24100 [Phytohabitans aurantiacus]